MDNWKKNPVMKTNLCYNPSLVTQYLSGYSNQLWSINTPFPCVAVLKGRHFQHCLWLTHSLCTKPNRDIRTNRGLWWVWEWGGCHPLHKHERTGTIYAIAQGKAAITTANKKKWWHWYCLCWTGFSLLCPGEEHCPVPLFLLLFSFYCQYSTMS